MKMIIYDLTSTRRAQALGETFIAGAELLGIALQVEHISNAACDNRVRRTRVKLVLFHQNDRPDWETNAPLFTNIGVPQRRDVPHVIRYTGGNPPRGATQDDWIQNAVPQNPANGAVGINKRQAAFYLRTYA